MLAVSSFKDELARFKTSVTRYREIVSEWRDAAGIDATWERIQQTARLNKYPDLDPQEFIRQMLSATWSVQPIVDEDKAIKADFERCRDEIIAAIEACNSPLEVLRLLEWEPDLCTYLHDEKEMLRQLARSGFDFERGSVVGRKDQNGSRDLAAFSHRMTRYLRMRCGQPCYEAVAQLASIALHRDVTIDQVMRRPTTKAKRKKR